MHVNIGDALRYAGLPAAAPEESRREMEAIARELERELTPRFTWRACALDREEGGIALRGTGVVLTGGLADRMLADCSMAALMVCTAGGRFDTLLRAGEARDMARAVLLDGCGSAFVEAVCDEAEREIAARFPALYLTDRFSPGYGDLPLELQPVLCGALDAERRVGVHVSDSLLLSPSKSVTAIVGLAGRPQGARIRGCACCNLRKTCALRKGGNTCAV